VVGEPFPLCPHCMGEGVLCPDPIPYPKIFVMCDCIKETENDPIRTTREVPSE